MVFGGKIDVFLFAQPDVAEVSAGDRAVYALVGCRSSTVFAQLQIIQNIPNFFMNIEPFAHSSIRQKMLPAKLAQLALAALGGQFLLVGLPDLQ